MPVGQPDGGRDALSRLGGDGGGFTVAQVKFKRKDEEENADWMIKALEGELPKIRELKRRGMRTYLMVTNASGTSHPGVGRIDRVQAWMDENLEVDARCVWRDDLDSHLANAHDIKLSFPALLTGQDTLTLVLQAVMGPETTRVERAFRAFVSTQYDMDEHVKFRQVDLSNSLFDLFVDVPLTSEEFAFPRGSNRLPRELVHEVRRLMYMGAHVNQHVTVDPIDGSHAFYTYPASIGTTDFLLNPVVQRHMPRIVLQGGPGQGKSTIAQFVCQIHRAMYLDRTEFLDVVTRSHAIPSFRLPMKIDARDLASYLERRPTLGLDEPADHKVLSFERFIALLIEVQSGGMEFSVDDLHIALKDVPALVFVDGLDEVADLGVRQRLVDEVQKGLRRLDDATRDLQVVVSTRPSLFGETPSFKGGFRVVKLTDISQTTVREYTEKWIAARRVPATVGAEIREILAEKVSTPHVAELTRNPMQLAIFLSLIASMGRSIPDVRTDLYRRYTELFMMRESEKDEVVREHHDLLTEIVELLAWRLQSAAETEGAAGRISADALHDLVDGYLRDGQHEATLADQLFGRGLERVYVLVQRIEGYYEFEVQPLREFFAARYLYRTAPVGSFRHTDPRGDRAQRFEALAANPYWANVVRFYAGSYESGELGALVTSLKELIASEDFAKTITARSIGAALLGDWVFKAKRFVQDELVELVFDNVGVDFAAIGLLSGLDPASLPEQCGRDRLGRLVLESRILTPAGQAVDADIAHLLRRNGGSTFGPRFLEWISAARGKDRTERFTVALASGGIHRLNAVEIAAAMGDDDPNDVERASRVLAILQHDRLLLDRDDDLAETALQTILDWGGIELPGPPIGVDALAILLGSGGTQYRGANDYAKAVQPGDTPSPAVARVRKAISALPQLDKPGYYEDRPWAKVERWEALLSAVGAEFGEPWAALRIAAECAGLLPRVEYTGEPFDLRDKTIPLLDRARRARAFRGRSVWWRRQLESVETLDERLFVLALLLSWAPGARIIELASVLETSIEELSETNRIRLGATLEEAVVSRDLRGGSARADFSDRVDPGRLKELVKIAVGRTFDSRVPSPLISARAYRRRLRPTPLPPFPGWATLSPDDRRDWAERFAAFHESGGALRHVVGDDVTDLSRVPELAEEIVHSPLRYPLALAEAAFASVMRNYGPAQVLDVSKKEGWQFD